MVPTDLKYVIQYPSDKCNDPIKYYNFKNGKSVKFQVFLNIVVVIKVNLKR